MKIKIGIALMILGFVLMAVVAGWNLYLKNEEATAESEANAALPEVLAAMEMEAEGDFTQPSAPSPSPFPKETSAAESTPPPSEMQPDEPIPAPQPTMKVVYAKNKPYVGTLQIPSLGLNLPIQAQWSYKKLKHTPCHYSGTAEGGDLVLIAHNYRSHFGRLKDLPVGATIIFTDAEGEVFTYAVDVHETLPPNQNGYLTAGDWDLSLSTCTVGGAMREVVRCTLVSAP